MASPVPEQTEVADQDADYDMDSEVDSESGEGARSPGRRGARLAATRKWDRWTQAEHDTLATLVARLGANR